jgi:hypothetical protein
MKQEQQKNKNFTQRLRKVTKGGHWIDFPTWFHTPALFSYMGTISIENEKKPNRKERKKISDYSRKILNDLF